MSPRLPHSLMLTAALAAALPVPAGAIEPVVATSSNPAASGKGSVRIFKSEVKAAPAERPMLDVRVATARDFTRLEFHWLRPAAVKVSRNGQELVLLFNRAADPDLARLRVDPPEHVRTAEARRTPGGAELKVILAEGSDAKVGQADGVTYVNLFAAAKPVDGAPVPTRPSGVPASGMVPVQVAPGAGLTLRFPFIAPVGAAVFRRGDALWIVFDAEAGLDLSKLPRDRVGRFSTVRGPGFTALRFTAPAESGAEASALGGVWTVALGPEKPRPPAIAVTAEQDAGPLALSAAMAGATAVRWITDPVVGDRIAVVTALAPAKGVPVRRDFVETSLLPSAHGLAIEPHADDLVVEADADIVRIYRPRGLALSGGRVRAPVTTDLPGRAAFPAVIDARWGERGKAAFLERQGELLAAAAVEAADGGSTEARMGLARFLIGSDLVHEGQGVLALLRRKHPEVANDPDFRGLQGAARTLIGRAKEADADFASPVLAADPSSALWRGLLASEEGDHARALTQFNAGAPALHLFAPRLRARFAAAHAGSALAMGDLAAAGPALARAGPDLPHPESLAVSLVQARLAEAAGNAQGALKIYDVVARTAPGAVGAEAELRLTRLKHATGGLDASGALKAYNTLRWRWRGDETELETLRTLGELYLRAGRHRQALSVLHAAGTRLPGSPAGAALQAEMMAVFRRLFLEGGADGMEPVQALALFYDFRDLTPIGADGDLMTRRLAQRLIAVDLLPQAAELLKHQAEQRLDGVARAQVATDLALVYLMDRQPEQALRAIGASRTTVLPTALNLERRVVEARALMALGRLDHALEIIGSDASPDALAVKAEIYWGQGQWPIAGAALERALAGGGGGPLSAADEARLLKAAVAYSLAGDGAALGRLRGRFNDRVATARQPDALRVALAGLGEDGLNAKDLTRVVSETDAFAGWVGEMKRRFRAKPGAAPAPQQAQAAAATAAG